MAVSVRCLITFSFAAGVGAARATATKYGNMVWPPGMGPVPGTRHCNGIARITDTVGGENGANSCLCAQGNDLMAAATAVSRGSAHTIPSLFLPDPVGGLR